MIQWAALTAVGLAGGLIAGVLAGMPLGKLVNAMIVTAAVTCLAGAVLGAFQAFGLRRVLHRPVWWIVATVVGFGAGLAAAVVVIEQSGILLTGHRPQLLQLGTTVRAFSFVILGLIAGGILGAAQAFVLKRQMPAVRYWMPATALCLAAALSASSLIVDLSGMHLATVTGAAAFVMLAGSVFGALTGAALKRAA